ncbi:hypothetical protein CGK74_07535 [Thauera propionica]|uniref:Uncharacterized protein n=1 Tax=Thauera propionica TaxID=2019431 RepID=A0A235F001_9RHOO|nr:hypothetical protein [Thauera propionica]OYD54626.1 hypothetical protein CGK74_07535 [Thauera propionica]
MTVFTKTPKGQEEITHRTGIVGQRARRLLILIDGHRGADELAAMSADDDIATTLSQLEEAGLIEAVANAAPVAVVPAAAAAPAQVAVEDGQAPKTGDLQLARDFMMNTLRTFHGPYAKLGLMKRIQSASDRDGLMALYEEWLASITETRIGRKRAEELTGRLMAVI